MKLRIEKSVYGGKGLARIPAEAAQEIAGKAVFVPWALPGELVKATVTAERRGYLTASLEAILEPATSRTTPHCEYYSRCGGCHYQHAVYDTQLALKRDILSETFDRAHLKSLPPIRTLAAEPWGYRNRIRLHVVAGSPPVLGYRESASHRDIAVSHCPVAAPLLQRCVAACNRIFQTHPAIATNLSEAEFFCNADQTALLSSLFTVQRGAFQELARQFAENLSAEVPELHGLHVFSLDAKSRRSIRAGSWGAAALSYDVNGSSYRVSAGGFFQVNRYLVPQLVHEVVSGREGSIAWDLYAGVGLFARALQGFRQVIAVESSPFATPDLAHNLKGAGSKARSVALDTLRFLKSPPPDRPDLVIVDPPRAGLGTEVCQRLAGLRPRQIVYVSCDPSTLARDLQTLQPSGYRPVELTLVDLFPQTFHMETVVTLERG